MADSDYDKNFEIKLEKGDAAVKDIENRFLASLPESISKNGLFYPTNNLGIQAEDWYKQKSICIEKGVMGEVLNKFTQGAFDKIENLRKEQLEKLKKLSLEMQGTEDEHNWKEFCGELTVDLLNLVEEKLDEDNKDEIPAEFVRACATFVWAVLSNKCSLTWDYRRCTTNFYTLSTAPSEEVNTIQPAITDDKGRCKLKGKVQNKAVSNQTTQR